MVYYLFIKLATDFGHTDHHQANIQKLEILTLLKFQVFVYWPDDGQCDRNR